MNGFRESIAALMRTDMGVFELVAAVIISLCAAAIFGAVFINFLMAGNRQGVKSRRRSIVATGTMTGFFFFFYFLIHLQILVLHIPSPPARIAMVVAGLFLIVFGCCVNIAGRLNLGRNWANQVTIYQDQKLVTSGVYALVRHPLYASLIWMFYGACMVYASLSAFLATSLIFLPFMYYRARLEENLLAKEFSNYDEYRRRVGMFFYKPVFLSASGGVREKENPT